MFFNKFRHPARRLFVVFAVVATMLLTGSVSASIPEQRYTPPPPPPSACGYVPSPSGMGPPAYTPCEGEVWPAYPSELDSCGVDYACA